MSRRSQRTLSPAGRCCGWVVVLALALVVPGVQAGDRLIATGGVSQVEGSGGGGIVPWALLSGYGTEGQNGLTAFTGVVDTGDYQLNSVGAAFTWNRRVEFSVACHDLDIGALSGPLGIDRDARLRQNVFGVKVRLWGNAIYPPGLQISAGLQHKRLLDFDIPETIGAADDSDTDFYLTAGKVFLGGLAGRNVYLNGTVRVTRANQIGLLGFGGDRRDSREAVFEGSAVVFLDRNTAIGVEYRDKPDNLSAAEEDAWADLFFAWFPSKRVSVTVAYAGLGSIATLDSQNGFYASVQVAF